MIQSYSHFKISTWEGNCSVPLRSGWLAVRPLPNYEWFPPHDLFFESLEGTIVNYLTFNKYPNNCGEHQNDTSLQGPIYSQSLFLRGSALYFLSVVLFSYFDIHVFLCIFLKKDLFCICMRVDVCFCVNGYWMYAGPWEARRGCWFAWRWSHRLCEPPDMGARSPTQFLWTSRKYSDC